MNHCVDCLHWDEDQADEQGYADCQNQKNSCLVLKGESSRFVPLRVSGDDTCRMFTPKQAVSKST